MWVSISLLFLAFTSASANIGNDITACVNAVDKKELKNVLSVRSNEDLEKFCPMILNAFDCVENVLTEAEMSFESLAIELKGTPTGKDAEFAKNVRDIVRDVCTEGSRLNEAVLADAECLDSMTGAHIDCLFKAEQTVESIAENAMEEGNDQFVADPVCTRAAYTSACVAEKLHDSCGRRAFDTFNEIVKRSNFLKIYMCSAEDLEHLKTTFVDKLGVDEDKKDLFRLAFDLRKRRK